MVAVLAAAAAVGAAGEAAWAQAAKPEASGVEAIWAYAGTWKTEMEHFDTAFSKAGKESSTLKNECWKSGGYVACRQIVDGDPKVLIVFTCKAGGECTSYQIPPDGSEAGSGKMTISGNTWTFPWSTAEGGKTTYFRVVNVWTSARTIEFRQEFSTDGKNWTRMASGHETKVSE
jgi:hypothetical protein